MKCSAAHLKHTMQRNISTGHSRTLEKILSMNSVPISLSGSLLNNNNVRSLALQRPDIFHRRFWRGPGSLQQVRRRRRGQSQHHRVRGTCGRRTCRIPRRHERAKELSQVGKTPCLNKLSIFEPKMYYPILYHGSWGLKKSWVQQLQSWSKFEILWTV